MGDGRSSEHPNNDGKIPSRNCCKHFAHRADAEHRGVRWHLARVAIGQAKALAPNDSFIIHKGDRDRGDTLIDELLRSGLPFLNRSIVGGLRRVRTAGGKKECRRGGKEPPVRRGLDAIAVLDRSVATIRAALSDGLSIGHWLPSLSLPRA
jgi:hypothetical protein